MARKLQETLWLGAWVTATVYVVNMLLSIAGFQVKELFGITPATGITSTVGQKFVELLQNFVSFDPTSLLMVYLSAVLIVYAGSFIKDNVKAFPQGRKAHEILAWEIVYGTAAFYLLLVGFVGLPIGTIIGFGLHTAAVVGSLYLFKGLAKQII